MDHRTTKPPRGTIVKRENVKPHLDIVLVRDGKEYITWLHNVQCGGYGHGHYAQTRDDNDFDVRVYDYFDYTTEPEPCHEG